MSVVHEPEPDALGRVELERRGEVALVTLRRPAALNALSEELRDQLISVVGTVAHDTDLRALVLTGEGRAFCSGGDIKAMAERLKRPAGEVAFAGWQRMHEVNRAILALHRLGKVTVAAVNGPAMGLGCDLALCCDFVVASSAASFAMSYIRRGLVPDGGGLYFLPRRVGLARAKELIFSGRTLQGAEAFELGLADRLSRPEELLADAIELASSTSSASPTALALGKAILDRSLELELDEVFELGAAAQAICYTSAEHQRSVEEFLESRRNRST
jgi:enoyl-CoA hydratase/carnithine racemase